LRNHAPKGSIIESRAKSLGKRLFSQPGLRSRYRFVSAGHRTMPWSWEGVIKTLEFKHRDLSFTSKVLRWLHSFHFSGYKSRSQIQKGISKSSHGLGTVRKRGWSAL